MENYSSGSRGALAKGVGRVTGARVRTPDSPPETSNNFVRCFFVVFRILLVIISDYARILKFIII